MSAASEMLHEIEPVRRAIADLRASAEFIRSPYFEQRIMEGLSRAAVKASSPWLNRDAAAAYVYCGVRDIDYAADAGVIPRHHRAGTPLFRKDEIDEAILKGKWPKRAVLLQRRAA